MKTHNGYLHITIHVIIYLYLFQRYSYSMRTPNSGPRQWVFRSNTQGGFPHAQYFKSEEKTAWSPLAYINGDTSAGLNAVFANNQTSLPKWDTLFNQIAKTNSKVDNHKQSAIFPTFANKHDAHTVGTTVYRSWSPDGTTSYSNTVGSPLDAIFPQKHTNAGVANGDKSPFKAWSSNGSPLGAISPPFHSNTVVENGDKSALKTWSPTGSASNTNNTFSNFNDIFSQMQTMNNQSNTGKIMFKSWSTGYQHPISGNPLGHNTSTVSMHPLRNTAPQFPLKSKTNESNLGQTVLKSWTSVYPNSRNGNMFGTFRTFNYNGHQSNVLGTNTSEVQNFNSLFEKLKSQASMPTSNKDFVNLPATTSNRYSTVNEKKPFTKQLPSSTLTWGNPHTSPLDRASHTSPLDRASHFMHPSVKLLPSFITKKKRFDASRLPTAHEVEQMFKNLDLTNFKRKHLKLSSLQIQDKLKNVALKWVQSRDITSRGQPIPQNNSASDKHPSSPHMNMSAPAEKTTAHFDKPLSTTLVPRIANMPENTMDVSQGNIWQQANILLANSRVIKDNSNSVDIPPPVFLTIEGKEIITTTSTPNRKEENWTEDQNRRVIVPLIPVVGNEKEHVIASSIPRQKKGMLTEDRITRVDIPPSVFPTIKGNENVTTISTHKVDISTEDQNKHVIVPSIPILSTLNGKEKEYIIETSTPKPNEAMLTEDRSDRVSALQLIVVSTLKARERNNIVTPIQQEKPITTDQPKGVIVPSLPVIRMDTIANITTQIQKQKILTSMKSTEDNSNRVNAHVVPMFSIVKGQENDNIAATTTLKQKEIILTDIKAERIIVPPLPVFTSFTGHENGTSIAKSTNKQKENILTKDGSNHVIEPPLRLVSTLKESEKATTTPTQNENILTEEQTKRVFVPSLKVLQTLNGEGTIVATITPPFTVVPKLTAVGKAHIRSPTAQAEEENILIEDGGRRVRLPQLPTFLTLNRNKTIVITTIPNIPQPLLTEFPIHLDTENKSMKDTQIDTMVVEAKGSKAKQTILKTTLSPFDDITDTPPMNKIAESALVITSTPPLRIVETPFKISTTHVSNDFVEMNTVSKISTHSTSKMSNKNTGIEIRTQNKATSGDEKFKLHISPASTEQANASIKQQENIDTVKGTIKPWDKQTSNLKYMGIIHPYANSIPEDKKGKHNTLVNVKSTVSPIFPSNVTYGDMVKTDLSTDIPYTRRYSEKGQTTISTLNISSSTSAKTLDKINPTAGREYNTELTGNEQSTVGSGIITQLAIKTELETNGITNNKEHETNIQTLAKPIHSTKQDISDADTLTNSPLSKATDRISLQMVIPSNITQTTHGAADMHTTIQPMSNSTRTVASDTVKKTRDITIPHTTILNMVTRGNFHRKMHAVLTSLPPPPMILERSLSTKRNLHTKEVTQESDNSVTGSIKASVHIDKNKSGDSRYNDTGGQSELMSSSISGGFKINYQIAPLIDDKANNTVLSVNTDLPPPPPILLDRYAVSTSVSVKTTTPITANSTKINLIRPIPLSNKESTQVYDTSVTVTMKAIGDIEKNKTDYTRYNGITGQSEQLPSIGSIGIKNNNLIISLLQKFSNTVHSATMDLPAPPPILFDVFTRVGVKATTTTSALNNNIAKSPMHTRTFHQLSPTTERNNGKNKSQTSNTKHLITEKTKSTAGITKNINNETSRHVELLVSSVVNKLNSVISPSIEGIAGDNSNRHVHSAVSSIPPPPPILFDVSKVSTRAVKTIVQTPSATTPSKIHLKRPISLSNVRQPRTNGISKSELKSTVTDVVKRGRNGNTLHLFEIPSNEAKLKQRKIVSPDRNSDNLAKAVFKPYVPYTERKQNNPVFEFKDNHVSSGIPISILELLNYGLVETGTKKSLNAIMPEIGNNVVRQVKQETLTQPLAHTRKQRMYSTPIIQDLGSNGNRKKAVIHNIQIFPKSSKKKTNIIYPSQLKSHVDSKITNSSENKQSLENANLQTGIKNQTRHGINILNSLLLWRVKRDRRMQLFHSSPVIKEISDINVSQSSGIVSQNVGSMLKNNRNIVRNSDRMKNLNGSPIRQLFIPSSMINAMSKETASQQNNATLTHSSTHAVNKYSEPNSTHFLETRMKTISTVPDNSANEVLTNMNTMHVSSRELHLKESIENKQKIHMQNKVQSLSKEYLLQDEFNINTNKLRFGNLSLQHEGARNRQMYNASQRKQKYISKNKPVNTSAYKHRSRIRYSREPKPKDVIASKVAGEYIHKSVGINPNPTPKAPSKRWNLFSDKRSSKTILVPDRIFKNVQNDSQTKNIPTSTEHITTTPRQRNTVIKKSNVLSLWDARPSALENTLLKVIPSSIRRHTYKSVQSHPKQSQIDISNGRKLGSGKALLFPIPNNFR